MMSRRACCGLLGSTMSLGCGAPLVPDSIPPGAPELGVVSVVDTEADDDDDDEVEVSRADYIAAHFDKTTAKIPMRDGVELFTTIYTPKRSAGPVPIILYRTPYSSRPYGEDAMPEKLGPSDILERKGWIFVKQDVRGRFQSRGDFVDMRPHIADKKAKTDIDESTDTYDTIEWLLGNVEGHNGRVGQWGISYPGFYTAAGMIDHHPALVAASPQAPIADWYFDDFHHHGAFFLPHAFNFFSSFGRLAPMATEWPERFDHGTVDGYRFFLDLGPLTNANERHFKREITFWNELVAHPNYDEFWQARNILPHLKDVAPAVLTVGGWFDAEDLYGPLAIYRTLEKQAPQTDSRLVMGPWRHGGWGRSDGDFLGDIPFEAKTARTFQKHLLTPFFEHHLAGEDDPDLAEAHVFETGANRWRELDVWPPAEVKAVSFYVGAGGALGREAPKATRAYDEWLSDPAHPVPHSEQVAKGMDSGYMIADQRFATARPDVVTWRSDPLSEAMRVGGPITAELWVSTSGTASDFVVKIIDEYPGDYGEVELPDGRTVDLGGYQQMLRSEVIRGRFRESYERPVPLTAGKATKITLPLQDVLHTFRPGHRIVVQVQSTWFPLVDINPHRYVANVFESKPSDFVKATQRVYRTKTQATRVVLPVLQ